ncbi:MAG TPA: sigma 54-interacting transcriptional regulator [Pirellulaceae bacterium]|nr:sigma 54-interacting transcriptional regulator [Pirellulaceae bacterium]HMO93720.1 sigma 54-interacting transcriptional regulator [Pirellulaceae bacterium]HMP69777.1 sigma 54-interacting transcriptional regulator [Pirellulaceae bacterium]
MAKDLKPAGLAYLVIREGTKWSDVFRLIPGRTVTIGRSPTCQIVIREDQASRQHAEIFVNNGRWMLRDLSSRNGTAIGEKRVYGDNPLKPGDVIWIARTQLAFVTDLSDAYGSSAGNLQQADAKTIAGLELDEAPTECPYSGEPTTITHRRERPKFHAPVTLDEDAELMAIPKLGKAAAKLCRLAFELANEKDLNGISKLALGGLMEGTQADAGAILAIPRKMPKLFDPEKLEVLAWQAAPKNAYMRVSKFLAETVVTEGEAVLARDIADDSALGIRDSKGEIQATSVICAPILVGGRIVGLVHLYSTNPSKVLDADDLDFTLAVAENVGLAMRNRNREQRLVEDLSKVRNEIHQLRHQLGVESELVGGSASMLEIHQQIARAAPSNATVLVCGESGVGKELVARAVHFSSERKKGPFVCLNCAALSESLLESELFGHERGAFTGATERKIGKFEAADKGTLMLDEIGEMSPSIQAKFLRVLEGHPFERVGGSKAIKVDVRVIAATNRNLEQHVRDGGFRKDLFFRLNVVKIDVPPLRRRHEDILPLAEHFLQKFSVETGKKIRGFSERAVRLLETYRWPGNVRELKNVIERAVVLLQGDTIDVDDLTLSSLMTASESRMEFLAMNEPFEPIPLDEMERKHILSTLIALAWNKSKTAAVLGIERSTLDRKIKRYDLERLKPAD